MLRKHFTSNFDILVEYLVEFVKLYRQLNNYVVIFVSYLLLKLEYISLVRFVDFNWKIKQ